VLDRIGESSATRTLSEEAAMEVLSSRPLLRPTDLPRLHAFYGDVLGLATCREFDRSGHRGVV